MLEEQKVTREEFRAFLHCVLQTIQFAPLGVYDGAVEELCEAYFEPHRVYHGPKHIMDYVRYLQSVREHFVEGDVLSYEMALCAALFHDVVYDIENPQFNESMSAREAVRFLDSIGFGEGDIAHAVFHSIILTNPDTPLGSMVRPSRMLAMTNPNIALFLDGDNMWLSTPEAFEAAEKAVVEEYSNVYPLDVVLSGRKEFYERFLDRTSGQTFLSSHNQTRNVMAQRLLEEAVGR